MKNKALKVGLLIGLTVLGALTYRVDSFRIVYPERIGYERFHRYSVLGIRFYQIKTNEEFPYDLEFTAIWEQSVESVTPVKRKADHIKTLWGSIYKCYSSGWTNRERREVLEAIYLRYRDNQQLGEAKEQLKKLNSILPADIGYLEENIYPALDALRVSLDLKPHLTHSEPTDGGNG